MKGCRRKPTIKHPRIKARSVNWRHDTSSNNSCCTVDRFFIPTLHHRVPVHATLGDRVQPSFFGGRADSQDPMDQIIMMVHAG